MSTTRCRAEGCRNEPRRTGRVPDVPPPATPMTFFRPLFLTVAFAAVPAVADAQAGRQREAPVPPVVPQQHMPPAGKCRIWMEGVAPAQQPAATDCQTALRQKPAHGTVIFGPSERQRSVTPFRSRTAPAVRDSAARRDTASSRDTTPTRRSATPRSPAPQPTKAGVPPTRRPPADTSRSASRRAPVETPQSASRRAPAPAPAPSAERPS